CFALYFFYLDAHYLANLFISAIPIDSKSTKQLLNKFRDVTKNLFMGFFMVAFYQAIAAFVIFSIFKIQGALLFSFLILFSSFVPMVGCALIWAPLTVTVFLSQGLGIAIAFAVFCSFFISFMDNFLRPLFLKDRIKIHPLLIFFSILGGLNVFGFNGILLGPLVIILFFTIVDIALEEDTLIHQG
ncbi:MAG TPA: AI-2E family transporter, partial [Treponemataceae bacterium]|nr:AI-2E family transporter [Treponemataceae bacterium]